MRPTPSAFLSDQTRGKDRVTPLIARTVTPKTRSEQWLEENRERLIMWGRYDEENGLPLDNYRQF